MPCTMKKYKSYDKIAQNHLNPQFTADVPNEKGVTDITEY